MDLLKDFSFENREKVLVGVISDTHGLLRPQAVEALQGVDLIVHAGDVGKPEILTELKTIAPVIAIRGNIDKGDLAKELPETDFFEVGKHLIYVLHDLKQLALDPVAATIRVVISGHSHKSLIEERKGVLYLNPGGAGHKRFNLPITVAHLEINGDAVAAGIIELAV